jgi:hypothetical protein
MSAILRGNSGERGTVTYRRIVLSILLGLAVAIVAAGCGKAEKSSSGESEDSKAACKAAATSAPTGLPAAFPVPGELTFTEVRKDGPTIVVDGYWTAGIDEAYKEFKDEVEQAGYKVLFNEKEEHDAEISYSGSGRTGQIALREDCAESETTRVHITNRPA